jgi:uncharacterized protein YodC (DUF2158 family)
MLPKTTLPSFPLVTDPPATKRPNPDPGGAGAITYFRPGDPVQQGGRSEELLVEGYDDFGRVICSFWEGAKRARAAFREAELKKVPLPPW